MSGAGGAFIGPPAGKLGIRSATPRKGEPAGLVRPRRDPSTGCRVYDDADPRDARLTRQLRWDGYRLEQIAPLIDQVRAAGGPEQLEAAPCDWRARLSARGRAMRTGAARVPVQVPDRLPRVTRRAGHGHRPTGRRPGRAVPRAPCGAQAPVP